MKSSQISEVLCNELNHLTMRRVLHSPCAVHSWTAVHPGCCGENVHLEESKKHSRRVPFEFQKYVNLQTSRDCPVSAHHMIYRQTKRLISSDSARGPISGLHGVEHMQQQKIPNLIQRHNPCARWAHWKLYSKPFSRADVKDFQSEGRIQSPEILFDLHSPQGCVCVCVYDTHLKMRFGKNTYRFFLIYIHIIFEGEYIYIYISCAHAYMCVRVQENYSLLDTTVINQELQSGSLILSQTQALHVHSN